MTQRKIESGTHNPLLAWWQVSNAARLGHFDTQLQGYRRFASELQRAWSDACRNEAQALLESQKTIAATMQAFLQCRRPEDVAAAQSAVIASLLDGVSRQAKTWVDITGRMQDCYADMTREAAGEALEQAEDLLAHNPVVDVSTAPAPHRHRKEAAHA